MVYQIYLQIHVYVYIVNSVKAELGCDEGGHSHFVYQVIIHVYVCVGGWGWGFLVWGWG